MYYSVVGGVWESVYILTIFKNLCLGSALLDNVECDLLAI